MAWIPVALAVLGSCRSAPSAPAPTPFPKSVPPSPVETTPKAAAAGPVTHLGRTVLASSDVVLRGRTLDLKALSHGAELGRVEALEVFRETAPNDLPPLTVMSAAAGALPAPGREALFFLDGPSESGTFTLVEIAPLDDADGDARLAAFRTYLDIEAVADPDKRATALREYLTGALQSASSWTRWNAAREFAALAQELPDVLRADDRRPLSEALSSTRERGLQSLLQEALDACPGGRETAAKSGAAPMSERARADLADVTRRFTAQDADVAARRQAVVDAALKIGAPAAPLFLTALSDPEPPVREAAVAAVGQMRVAALEPNLAAMLTADASSAVRRTLIIALGYLRSTSSVSTLAMLARDDSPFAKEASYSLARIRTQSALDALRRLARDTTDPDRRKLLEFLASDAFLDQERALGDSR